MSIIKMFIFASAMVLSTSFSVYLFIARKKTEYSIIRALGVTRRRSAFALAVPLLVVTAAAVIVGVAAAWLYVAGTIERSDLLLSLRQSKFNTSVPVEIVLSCAFGELLLTLVSALVFLRRMGSVPPLMLLQTGNKTMQLGTGRSEVRVRRGGTVRKPGVKKEERSAPPPPALNSYVLTIESNRHARSFGFVLRYAMRHLSRAAGKSVLVVLLATVLFAVVGRFALVRDSYTELVNGTEITARIVGGARLSLVPKIMESGYVSESYYETSSFLDFTSITTPIIVTNDFERYAGEEVLIDYADGYDETSTREFGNIVFVGNKFAEKYEVEPGDIIVLTPCNFYEITMDACIVFNKSMLKVITEDELRELLHDEVEEIVQGRTEYFTVAGVFWTPAVWFEYSAFAPGSFDSDLLTGVQSVLRAVEYTLDDNMLADEFREFCVQNVSGMASGRTELIMDTGKIDGAKRTLKLLDMLNPIIYAAALIIGSVLCCIITLQSSKEAALMRVLGTTWAKTGALLSVEQTLLTVAGLVIGAFGLLGVNALVNQGAPALDEATEASEMLVSRGAKIASWLSAIRPGLLFSLLYFATIVASAAICSTLATRRRPLELLQVRE